MLRCTVPFIPGLNCNIGIYREYEDTKDAIKETKIDTGFTDEERRLARARAQPTDKGSIFLMKNSLTFHLIECNKHFEIVYVLILCYRWSIGQG